MNKTPSQEPFISLTFDKLKKHWKQDMLSGFLIFLIALPLSLGIAIGSSFPPIAGIIAAVVGGIVVAIFSGSHLTICGPAAGLIVVIIHGVETLGQGDTTLGYTTTLAAIFVAGLLIMLFGFLKSGKLATFFPAAVVHGMMASIGIIIIAKQIHVLLGVKPEGKNIINLILEIPASFTKLNPEVTLIGLTSLLILIFVPKIPFTFIKKIPVPMLVVIVGIMFDKLFDLEHTHVYRFFSQDYVVGPTFLVQLPKNILDGIVFPNWSLIGTGAFWFVTFSIALVASLESLLSASAIQDLDPEKRKANFDKDLIALGIGTTISGFLGGLPMIAEIVRSSSNVNNGAKTPWSNFFHGFFLLVFVAGAPWLLQQIPLASLAALLVFVGWRLGSPKEFIKTYKIGFDQLIIFGSTVVMTIAVDLLVGVIFGIIVKIIIYSIWGLKPKEIFLTNVMVDDWDAETVNIRILDAASFWAVTKVKDTLYSLPQAKVINLDLSDCRVVDHSMMEFLERYKLSAKSEGISFNISGEHGLRMISDHELGTRRRA